MPMGKAYPENPPNLFVGSVKPNKNIVETQGDCKSCGKKALLANGLCVDCWDKASESTSLRNAYKQQKQICNIKFTRREIEILTLLSSGLSNLAIANGLRINPKTVEHHIHSLFSKIIVPKEANPRVWIAVNIAKVLKEGAE